MEVMTTTSDNKKEKLTPTQARAARRERRRRRRRTVRFLGFTAVSTIAALFIFSLFAGGLPLDFGSPKGPEGPGQRFESQGTTHIERGESHPPYFTTPAVSGWHYFDSGAPARWGVYDEPLEDEVLIHNLEHGGVGIHYDCPEGCDDLIIKLKEIADRSTEVIMSPYPELGSRIALTAWTFIEIFEEFDEEKIEAFISAHVNSPNAPEYLSR